MTRKAIAMVVYNDLSHDARVFKEATALSDAGYRVHVIGMRDSHSVTLSGWENLATTRLNVGRARSLRVKYFRFWVQAYRTLVAHKPDVIHAHDLDTLLPAWLAARHLKVPLVHDAHELWVELPSLVGRPLIRSIWSALARTLIPRCDAVITVSEGLANEHKRRYGVTSTVLRNIPYVKDDVQPVDLRSRIGIGRDIPILLYQGGLLPGLGIDRAIDTMNHLPYAHLVIIGDGPLRDEIRHAVETSPARQRITMLPPVPFAELPPITQACDIGLYLGTSPGLNIRFALPNKVFEYIAACVPSVITDWPDQAKLARQHGTGVVVPANASPQEIGEAVREVLAHHDTYVENCRAARRLLTWEREQEHLLRVYERLQWSKR